MRLANNLSLLDPMTADSHALALRLQTLPEEEISALHERLVRKMTGVETGPGVRINRTLHLVETTDSERGRLIRSLLGSDPAATPEPWEIHPANLQLCRTLSYRQTPAPGEPRYSSPGRGAVSKQEAGLLLARDPAESPEPLLVEGHFANLPEGWTVAVAPPVSPSEFGAGPQGDVPSLWVLICRNAASAHVILGRLAENGMGNSPLLVVIDEPGPTHPDHLGHVRCCSMDEAPVLLGEFFIRAGLFIEPDKRQLIRAITALHSGAVILAGRHDAESCRNDSLRHALDLAETEWRMLFIEERREAIRDVQLMVMAHPTRKMTLILTSEREAQLSRYIGSQLAPRIRNFVRSQAIRLAGLDLHPSHGSTIPGKHAWNSDTVYLRAGLLMALPNLALLMPSVTIEPSAIAGTFGGQDAGASSPDVLTPDPGGLVRDAGEDQLEFLLSAVNARLGHFLGMGKEWAMDVVRAPLSEVAYQMRHLDTRVGQLLGMLIAGQVAVAVAGIIKTVVMIRGSMNLTQTEEMIMNLLDDTEKEWPRIRESLEAMIPQLGGDTSAPLVERAHAVLSEINAI